jgi:hypothetical protein
MAGEKRGNRERDLGRGSNLDVPRGKPARKVPGPKKKKLGPKLAAAHQHIKPKKSGVHGAAKLRKSEAERKKVQAKSHIYQGHTSGGSRPRGGAA